MRRKIKGLSVGLLLLLALGGACTALAGPGQVLVQGATHTQSPCSGGWMWMDMECDPPAVMCGFGLVSTLLSNPALVSSSPNEGPKSPHFWIASGQPADFPPQIPPVSRTHLYLSSDLGMHPARQTSIHLFNSVLTL